ncbi:MAG: hypothetical protein JXA28_13805 [Bacteroidetes bacterium]|nr:hypothetical protein [Bacteroidota bacterium]
MTQEAPLPDSLRIGIVGGSLAGCAAAILLLREGHTVTVHERSAGALRGRGGGIGTTSTVLNALMRNDVIDVDFPHCSTTTMPFIGKHAEHEPLGRTPWSMPLDLQTFHWSHLWLNLRTRVPSDRYRAASPIIGADIVSDGSVSLRTEQGEDEEFDLVLFADGAHSFGRQILFPEAELRYRGYMLWRGLLPESAIEDSSPLEGTAPRLAHLREPGSTAMYLIPGSDGSTVPGSRLCNWAMYVPLQEKSIPRFMTGRDGRRREGMLPPGSLHPDEEQKLKQIAQNNLPRYYADIIGRSTDTYAHLMYTVDVPSYYRERMCLIGDAGVVIQPFTGSGIFKGYNNVRSLIDSLHDQGSIDRALPQWNAMQLVIGRRLLALGDQMEKALIWNPLNVSTAGAEAVEAWWKASVRFPDDFTLQRS